MGSNDKRYGKRLIRGTGFYTLTVLINVIVVLLLGAAVWAGAAAFVYGKGHFTAVIGWVLLAVFGTVYCVLRILRAPFGRKLDETSLQRSQTIVDGAAAVAAVVVDPSALEYSDGDEIPGGKVILVILMAIFSLMIWASPLLFFHLSGGDVKAFFSAPSASKPTLLAEVTIGALILLTWGYHFISPVRNFIRRLIWGKRFAQMAEIA